MSAAAHAPNRYVEISAKDLRVAYDEFVALTAEELHLRGNIISVIGHNGAGKSTFIKTILGLLQPTRGRLDAWNVEHGQSSKLIPEKHMAFCPEIGAVFSDISVESYIKLWCRIKHGDGNYYKKSAGARYIDLLHIAPLLRKRGRELSKGQRRRVQTAIGFLIQPRLFLFDEPFDGLDVQKTSELADIIREESTRTSFIISSHRMDVVERLSDVLVVLKEGRFHSWGNVAEVCTALCGKSILISQVLDPATISELLTADYPHCLLSQIGQQISITGFGLSSDALSRQLRKVEPGIKIDEVQPSLVEAVNFHLKDLSGGRPNH